MHFFPVAHCASSRQIITHWKNCTRADCPVCLPLKSADKRTPGGINVNQNSNMTAQNSQGSNVTDQATMKRAFESLGLPYNQNTAQHNAAAHPHPQMNAMQSDGKLNFMLMIMSFSHISSPQKNILTRAHFLDLIVRQNLKRYFPRA